MQRHVARKAPGDTQNHKASDPFCGFSLLHHCTVKAAVFRKILYLSETVGSLACDKLAKVVFCKSK